MVDIRATVEDAFVSADIGERGQESDDGNVCRVAGDGNDGMTSECSDKKKDVEAQKGKWLRLLECFQQYGKCSTGNRLKIFSDGDEAFNEMFHQIDKAKKRVWLEVYIFDDSSAAEMMVNKLRQAANRGCDVVVLIDWIGGFNLSSKWIKQMQQDGVHLTLFNPVLPGDNCIGPIFFRDHRKILITDDVAFCGSMNVSADAAGRVLGNNRFYEIHVKVEGPAVSDISAVFCDSLIESSSGIVRSPISPPPSFPGGSYVQILESNVRRNKRSIQPVLESVVMHASSSLQLTTSYFMPPGFLRRSLIHAVRKGVDVSLLLSGKSDIPGDVFASTHVVRKFLDIPRASSRVFFMRDRHCHAKCLVVDGVWASIGSFNWDRYSSRRNLEVVLSVFDPKVAYSLRQLHESKVGDESTVTEMTLRGWYERTFINRAVCAMAYSIARIAGKNVMDGLSNARHKTLLRRALVHTYLEEKAGVNMATGMLWGFQ